CLFRVAAPFFKTSSPPRRFDSLPPTRRIRPLGWIEFARGRCTSRPTRLRSAKTAIPSATCKELDERSEWPDLLEGPIPHVFPVQPKRCGVGRHALESRGQ